MATGQTILNLMAVLDQELQVQPAEADVVPALIALNAAQDFFEGLLALKPNVMGDTVGTIATVANTEATAFPTGVLRIDRLQFINPDTARPQWDLDRVGPSGGHAQSYRWPYYLMMTQGSGRPTSYWTNGRNIYWNPLPDATHTVRWYGLQAATDITAGGTFLYPDIVMLPLASFAVKLMGLGVGDDVADHASLANETFSPVISVLERYVRDRVAPFDYRYRHIT